MNMYPRVRMLVWCMAAAAIGFGSSPAWAQADDHGRISYATEDALLRGEDEDEWAFAGLNTLILPGDRIWADNSGALEIELPYGYFVRLADGSELEVISMPRDGRVHGWVGSFYVQRTDESRGDLIFETPAGEFDFDEQTLARFDVLEDGATSLTVHEGRVGVYTDSGRTMDVSDGNRVYIDPGFLPSVPERIDRDENQDGFDRWNELRARRVEETEVDDRFRNDDFRPLGVRDLNNHGDWVFIDNRRFWRPSRVHGFVPYRHGRWSFTRHHGYVWVGHHPFSYVTTHYGFWRHHHHHGWIWSYDSHYAPSRVVSFRKGGVFFWAPADRHGHPVHADVDFRVGDFKFSFGFTSFTHANHITHLDHHAFPVHPFARHHWKHYGHHAGYFWRPHHLRFAHSWWHHPHYRHLQHRTHLPKHHRRGPRHHPYGRDAILVQHDLEKDHGGKTVHESGKGDAPHRKVTQKQRRTAHRRIARQAEVEEKQIQKLRDQFQQLGRKDNASPGARDSDRDRGLPATVRTAKPGTQQNPRAVKPLPRIQTERGSDDGRGVQQRTPSRSEAASRVNNRQRSLHRRDDINVTRRHDVERTVRRDTARTSERRETARQTTPAERTRQMRQRIEERQQKIRSRTSNRTDERNEGVRRSTPQRTTRPTVNDDRRNPATRQIQRDGNSRVQRHQSTDRSRPTVNRPTRSERNATPQSPQRRSVDRSGDKRNRSVQRSVTSPSREQRTNRSANRVQSRRPETSGSVNVQRQQQPRHTQQRSRQVQQRQSRQVQQQRQQSSPSVSKPSNARNRGNASVQNKRGNRTSNNTARNAPNALHKR